MVSFICYKRLKLALIVYLVNKKRIFLTFYSWIKGSNGVTAFGNSKQYKNLQKTQTRLLRILHKHELKTHTQNQIFQNNSNSTQPNTSQINTRQKTHNTNTLNKTLKILNLKNILDDQELAHGI